MSNKKGGFYLTYSNVENGEFAIHSLYFPRMTSFSDPNSHYDPITGRYNTYTPNEIDEAMKFYLEMAGGELLGAGIGALRGLSWLSRVGRAGKMGDYLVQFGKTENQVYHTFRHIEALGLDKTLVETAIKSDLPNVASKIINGKPFNRIITVAGKKLQYTAYKLADGTINIGRIHGVK